MCFLIYLWFLCIKHNNLKRNLKGAFPIKIHYICRVMVTLLFLTFTYAIKGQHIILQWSKLREIKECLYPNRISLNDYFCNIRVGIEAVCMWHWYWNLFSLAFSLGSTTIWFVCFCKIWNHRRLCHASDSRALHTHAGSIDRLFGILVIRFNSNVASPIFVDEQYVNICYCWENIRQSIDELERNANFTT